MALADASSTHPSADTFSGLMKGIGGIAASVITAVLIFYLTRPVPVSQQQQTKGSPTRAMEFYGVVADATSRTLIPNATVVLALGQNSVSQRTDSLGQYNLALESAGAGPVMGTVQIAANGYQPYSNTVKLHPGTNFAEITLQTNAPPRGAAPPQPAQRAPGAPVASPARPGITFTTPPSNYARRQSVVVLRARQARIPVQ